MATIEMGDAGEGGTRKEPTEEQGGENYCFPLAWQQGCFSHIMATTSMALLAVQALLWGTFAIPAGDPYCTRDIFIFVF